MLAIPLAVIKHPSQMPVRGVEEFHFHVILPEHKQFFPTAYHRPGGFAPLPLKINRPDRFFKVASAAFPYRNGLRKIHLPECAGSARRRHANAGRSGLCDGRSAGPFQRTEGRSDTLSCLFGDD